MRLTLISTRLNPQASAIRFASLCNELVKRGHQVSVMGHPSLQVLLDKQVELCPWRFYWNPFAPLTLAWRLFKNKADVIHAHDDQGALALMRATGRACARVATLSNQFPHFKKALKALDGALLHSHALQERLGVALHTQVIFPFAPPLDLSAQAGADLRQKLRVPYGVKVALVSVEMTADCGLMQLLTDWSLVGDVELWVVGSGEASKELELCAQKEGLLIRGSYDRSGRVNGVRWLGKRSDWAALLCACDCVLILPKSKEQNRILAQALLAEKPVLCGASEWAKKVLPLAHVLPENQSGQQTLIDFLADLKEAKAMQQSAFDLAKKEWTSAAVATQVERFYQQVAKKLL